MEKKIRKNIDKVTQRLLEFDKVVLNLEAFEGVSDEEAEKKGVFLRDFGMEQWDWPQGVGVFSLHQAGGKNDEYIKNWAKSEIAKGLPTKNVNTIAPLLTLIDYPEYEELCLEWMEWIESEFPRTKENGLQHITSGVDKFNTKENKEQIWIDTVFMTILFIAKMGVKYNNQKWIDDAVYQVLLHTKYLLDRESSLFYHGWNFIENGNYGGNLWCRGNSWFTIGIPTFLEIVDEKIDLVVKQYLIQLYQNQVSSLMTLRAENKMWHTILDDKDSYTETSGSSGILAGMYMGLNAGLLNKEKIDSFLLESIDALMTNFIQDDGTVLNVSAGTPISHKKEDYKEIIQIPMVYGQAMTILALQEASKYLSKLENRDD